MASYLISDAPYAPWLSEVLATLEEHKIDRITIAAPLADGEVFTGYYLSLIHISEPTRRS